MDTWIYKDVSPHELIKSVSKDTEVVLSGYGTSAKTQITETPQEFEIPQIPGGQPKKDKTVMTGCNPLVQKACEENG